MNSIKTVTLLLLFCVSICFADRIEFPSGTQSRAELIMTPILSQEPVAATEGTFTLPYIDKNRGLDSFSEISVPGLVSIGELGRPSLPTIGTLIAVPEGYRAELTVLERQEATVANTWVAPYQSKTRCDCDKAQAFIFDSTLYESENIFPSQMIALQNVGFLQSLKFVRVAINPIQFHPGEKAISVVYRLKFQVHFIKESTVLNTGSGNLLSKTVFGLAQNLAANGKYLGSAVVSNKRQETMLIVTPDNLKDALDSFVKWKTQKGIKVELISFEKAGGTTQSLQKFIQDYYNEKTVKPTYLLLVGNAESLPPFFEKTTTGGGDQVAASDYPYSLLSGKDPIPDILYGRLLADNKEEVITQTSRWIEYEKQPDKDAWYSHAAVISSMEKGTTLSDKEYVSRIAANLKKYTYKVVDEFSEGDETATFKNISSVLSEGRSWITYMGHGSGLGWTSTNDSVNTSSLVNLSNSRLPFILDVSCANADYIHHQNPFGKAWVTAKSGTHNVGAVAYYGGSVNISWDAPAIMAIGISKSHFEKSIPNLGGTVLAGQIYLSEQKGSGNEFLDNLRWYQLLGDPSLELRTDQPTSIKLTQEFHKTKTAQKITLQVKDNESRPLSGILVALSSSNNVEPLAEGKTDAAGTVNFNLKSKMNLSSGLLTLTGYNVETLVTPLEQK